MYPILRAYRTCEPDWTRQHVPPPAVSLALAQNLREPWISADVCQYKFSSSEIQVEHNLRWMFATTELGSTCPAAMGLN